MEERPPDLCEKQDSDYFFLIRLQVPEDDCINSGVNWTTNSVATVTQEQKKLFFVSISSRIRKRRKRLTSFLNKYVSMCLRMIVVNIGFSRTKNGVPSVTQVQKKVFFVSISS